MKLRNILLISILCLQNISVFAQANNADYNLETRQIDIKQRDNFGITESDFNNIEGSPYANEEFLPGNIYKDNKPVYGNILLRYNIFSGEIEIKNSADVKEDSFKTFQLT